VLIHFALFAMITVTANAADAIQFVCEWKSPGTSPPDSYTLYQLELGPYQFDNAPAKLTRLESTTAEGAVISGVGPSFTEAPPLSAVIVRAEKTQTFFDDQVTYVRDYLVEHKRDDESGDCQANDDLGQCRYGIRMKVILDPCGSASPFTVLFPTGLNPRCRVEYKSSHPRPAVLPNRALPWEQAGANAFLNSWSASSEIAQRSRCDLRRQK
jgi:hypothetical protein